MGAIKAHKWKELVEQAEIAEKSAKSLSPQCPRTSGGSATRSVMQSNLPNPKGKKL